MSSQKSPPKADPPLAEKLKELFNSVLSKSFHGES